MSHELTQLCEKFTPGKTGHVVILLPGLQGTISELGSLPKTLINQGHGICIPKLEGYYAQTGFNNYEMWLAQLDQVVSILIESHEVISIIGLSMGATLAIAYEANFKKRFTVIALSPVLAFDGWSVPWYYPILRLAFKLGITNWHYKESEPYGLRNLQMRNRVAKQILEQETTDVGSASLSAKHLHEALLLIEFTKEIIADFTANLMVICSVDDDVVAPPVIDWLCKNVSSTTCKMLWLGNSYHIITLDNEREIVINQCIDFLHESLAKNNLQHFDATKIKKLVIRARLNQ